MKKKAKEDFSYTIDFEEQPAGNETVAIYDALIALADCARWTWRRSDDIYLCRRSSARLEVWPVEEDFGTDVSPRMNRYWCWRLISITMLGEYRNEEVVAGGVAMRKRDAKQFAQDIARNMGLWR